MAEAMELKGKTYNIIETQNMLKCFLKKLCCKSLENDEKSDFAVF